MRSNTFALFDREDRHESRGVLGFERLSEPGRLLTTFPTAFPALLHKLPTLLRKPVDPCDADRVLRRGGCLGICKDDERGRCPRNNEDDRRKLLTRSGKPDELSDLTEFLSDITEFLICRCVERSRVVNVKW